MNELDPATGIHEEEHPDYVSGIVSDETSPEEFAPVPSGSIPGPISDPRSIPQPTSRPQPWFCGPVSGTYRYMVPFQLPSPPRSLPPLGSPPSVPRPVPGPIVPINALFVTVRVDVDRYFPQNRISIEVVRPFPRSTAHAVAEVTSDRCTGFNRRVVGAGIVYRDGNAALIPGTTVTFTARRTTGFAYDDYRLTLSGGGITPRTYELSFQSRYFDPVEFEVDRVANAGTIVTSYPTGSHPTRPADLPSETLSLATVYRRAGFDVSMSPGTTIPTSGAGANGTWSDAEMHNAMATYWSRFANRPQWAMWVLYAARHDTGRSLGGVMFDDIGPNHRQGTAIFTDSFIQDAPPDDPSAAAWRDRMQFWTAVHEMGHAFNLAHSWQKALGTPVAPGDPWIPLANEPEARSFMNYPFRVAGGESTFFSDFRFRFTDSELVFMRHAPRRFVQMGNSDWFDNHGFEAPEALRQTGAWALVIRPNRDGNSYRFLEPVTMELKLTNTSAEPVAIEPDLLSDGRHFTLFVQREGAAVRPWRPLITRCHETHTTELGPGESLYGAHVVSASTDGWLIDEPGFYKLQAAVDLGREIVVSNVLRLHVAPPESNEAAIASDYFTEEVGRTIAFDGAPVYEKAYDVLRTVRETCADNPAAKHAAVALTSPMLRDFKLLVGEGTREDMAIETMEARVDEAAEAQTEALLDDPATAADTLGHIPYFGQLRTVAEAMESHGDDEGAIEVMSKTIEVMKQRDILPSVIDNAERRLRRRR